MCGLLILFLLIAPICGQHQDGHIRLIGGSYQWEGRVEIYISGTWGAVTDSDWTNNDAQVVCRKIGHFKPGATAYSRAYFGEASESVHLESVKCSGSEYSLTDCETENAGTSNSHSLAVGVKCQPADEAYREGDIRLVGGAYNWEGHVEIFWMGKWGTISDSSWTTEDAIVVCRQLQHFTRSGVPIPCCDVYGEGGGDIHIRNVACNGSEKNITSCVYFNNAVLSNHHQDVRVQCQQGNEVQEGDIHLIGSSNFVGQYVYGRVEIFLSGEWGTVSSDGASTVDARVVCRQLGYNTYRVDYTCCAGFGEGTGPIHFRYPQCSGLEHRLNDCQYDTNTISERHSEDWGIYCYVGGFEPGDIRLSFTYSGYVEVFLSEGWVHVANTNMTWKRENSLVVCRELGYAPNDTTWYPTTWSNTASEQVDNVVCTGTEPQLRYCSFYVISVESPSAVRVYCEYNDCSTGDVRLAGGETEAEGRVEICSSGRWGTVCDNQWTDNHTAVVCRHLGYSDIIGDSSYFTSGKFGSGTGPILMDSVHCTGSEPRVWEQCIYFTHYYGCTHNDDVGVHCHPASCSDGQLKLIEGNLEYYGRVEICSNWRWETLNFYQWTSSAARVACIELGFYTYIYWRTRYGRGGGPMHPKYYQCSGTELRLSQCDSYNDTAIRTHYDDVGIYCRQAYCDDWELRLSEGETEMEGRLEICFNRRWCTVGNEGWSQANSRVVCNNYGYDATDNSTANRSIPQSLSKPVHIHNVICQNTTLTLDKCSHDRYSGNSNDATDVIIICQLSSCADGDLKLVGGRVVSEGRLQICFNQRWTTINANRWTDQYTKVACKQLGYPTSDVTYFTRMRSSEYLPVMISDITCYGSEERLIDCDHGEYSGSLSTSQDVYISCIMDETSTASIINTSNTTVPENCVSGDNKSDNSGSQMTNIVIACLVTALLCFSIFIGSVAGHIFIVQRKKERSSRENVKLGDTPQTSGDGENVTTGDNISYMPSTGHTKLSEGKESLDYKSVHSVSDESMSSRQQQLPPIPLVPVTQGRGMGDHIYDTCK